MTKDKTLSLRTFEIEVKTVAIWKVRIHARTIGEAADAILQGASVEEIDMGAPVIANPTATSPWEVFCPETKVNFRYSKKP